MKTLPISPWEEPGFQVPIHHHDQARLAGFENSRPVPCSQFPFDTLDDAEDFIRETIARQEPIGPIIIALLRDREMEIRAEAVRLLIGILLQCDKKALAVYAMADACGQLTLQGISQTQAAKLCGCSKQNVQQLSDQFTAALSLRQTRTHRGAAARKRMSLANYRHKKINQ